MPDVRRALINPNSTNSLVLFLLGSIVAGFAAGLGWGLASRLLEKNVYPAGEEAYRAIRRGYRSRKAYPMPYQY